ncbi:transposable element Tcb2 transposase [Trichonephila clavipes]|nr:transposable element Tcb2 transposase [Trichonephila clavipes]
MSQRRRLPNSLRWRAVGWMEMGLSQADAARRLNVSRSVVQRLWDQYQSEDSVSRRPLVADHFQASGRRISATTVRNRLHNAGLYARRPVVCVPLNGRQRRNRLCWAREHVSWTQQQWASVLFTDESRFTMESDSGRLLIWREQRTRYHQSNTVERHSYRGGGILILDPYVRPYAAAIGNDFILMDDNARPHRARIVEEYLEDHGLERMEWPAQSPDLNPIEHLWDYLGREVAALNPPPRSLHELKQGLLCVWSSLPIPVSDNLINSMGNRCRQCIQDEVEKLAYQLNEEAERTERPIRRLSKVMYGSTCADMQVDVMGECLSSIKHVVGRQIAGEIARHTTQTTGQQISRFTLARRLHGGGLFARRPVRCVPLTPAHRRRRSLWCREHRNWRDNEWGRVLFTDESRFSLSSDSHRILIWRERGSRNHPSNIIERDRYGGRGVLVWRGIMLGSRTDLHIFDAGSVNGTRYCNVILLPYVGLFRGAMGLQFLFMDDNAPCHRRVAAEQLLESEDIERMNCPARSPDLNPIENVWDFLGRRLAARTLPPVTIRELRLALQDEWAAMPQQLIDALIFSMDRRCETCLAVRGDHIPYYRPDVSCWTPITGMFRPSVALRPMLLFQ